MVKNKKRIEPVLTPKIISAGMLLMLLLIAEVFFDTWCGVQCRRTGYEIVQAMTRRDKLKDTRKKLQIERVRLKSPQVLGLVAREAHGLATPKPEQIVIIP